MAGRRTGWSGITATDQFCGAGGSTTGAKRAGVEVRCAMNHWARAVETYNTNHPDTDVHCADVSAQDPRRFPSTDILITSPECTTHSPAGGNRRSRPDLFTAPEPDDPAFIRSRATMRDVPRFAEYHEYKLIIVENVVEVTRWGPGNDGTLFRHWLHEMEILGYRWKLVSLNSMFCWPTPQSRDRLYIVFWRKGNRAPDLMFTPQAPCHRCEKVVNGIQTWKQGALSRAIAGQPYGKYKTQYVYTCPVCRSETTPFYYAALNAIDFSLAAERIGDRKRPLKDRTLERIEYGLKKFGNRHLVIRTNMTTDRGYGPGDGQRVRGLDEPHFSQTASWLDGLFSPFIVRSQHSTGGPHARPMDAPMGTQTASGLPGLVTPGFTLGYANGDGPARPLDDPLNTTHGGGNAYGLVGMPFVVETAHTNSEARRPRGLEEAMATMGAQQTAALVSPFLFSAGGRDSMAPIDDASPTMQTRDRLALLSPFLITERTHNKGNPLDDALPTACAGTIHHALIQGAAQISMRDADGMRVAGLDRELMAQGCGPQQGIMSRAPFFVSYYGSNNVSPADAPVPSITSLDRHGVARAGETVAVEDCYFRMLQPHEIGRAMAFADDYKVTGNKRDQVKQYGNAVTPPAMDQLVQRAIASIAPEVAA